MSDLEIPTYGTVADQLASCNEQIEAFCKELDDELSDMSFEDFDDLLDELTSRLDEAIIEEEFLEAHVLQTYIEAARDSNDN